MNDLESLFEASGRDRPHRPLARAHQEDVRAPDRAAAVMDSAQNARVRDIRRLVGDDRETAQDRSADLSRLLGVRQETRQDAHADLLRLVRQSSSAGEGEHRRAAAAVSADLATLVGPAGARPDDLSWAAPELARAGKRPLFSRRNAGAVNLLSIAVAIVAVLALVGATSFALVQRATANPADDAMVSLREREAELANQIDQVRTAMNLYSSSVEAANASIAAARDVLPSVGPRVPSDSLNAAQAAQATLERLVAQPPSVAIPNYSRAPIDESSLVDVGHALDEVREIEDSLPAMMTGVRDARADLIAGLTVFRGALVSVGGALQAAAAERVGVATAADDSFRAAVAVASTALGEAQAAGGDGLSEMSAVVSALDALEAENQRAIDQRRTDTDGTTRGTTVPRSSSPPVSRSPSSAPSSPAPQVSAAPDPEPEPQPQPSPSGSASESAGN